MDVSWIAVSLTCSRKCEGGESGGRVHPRADHPHVGAGGKVLARYNGDPVLVEQGRHMVATFHPELSQDNRIHRFFLDKIA